MLKWFKKLFKKEDEYKWIGYEVSFTYSVPKTKKTYRDKKGRFMKNNQFGKLKKGMKYVKRS